METRIGIVSIITIVFIILKATGLIAWSWVWVFSPVWIWAAFLLMVALFLALATVIKYFTNK